MDSLRYLRGYSRGTIVEQEGNARGVPVEDCPVQRLPFYVKDRVCILVRIGATQQARIGAAQHLKGSVRTRQRERVCVCVCVCFCVCVRERQRDRPTVLFHLSVALMSIEPPSLRTRSKHSAEPPLAA